MMSIIVLSSLLLILLLPNVIAFVIPSASTPFSSSQVTLAFKEYTTTTKAQNHHRRTKPVNTTNLFSSTSTNEQHQQYLEQTWRYTRKPLLRIGSKGISKSHGNSLKELLSSHTVVKIKCNPNGSSTAMEDLFQELKQMVGQQGLSNIELIQFRTSQKLIQVGLEGTMDKILSGEFPPPPPPPSNDDDDNSDDE